MAKKENEKSENGFDIESLKGLAGGIAEDLANFVKKYPLQSVAGAAALGLVLGLLINKKRNDES